MKHVLVLALLAISLLSLPSIPLGPVNDPVVKAQGNGPPITSGYSPRSPIIDGRFSPGEWDAATLEPFTFFMIDLSTGVGTISIPVDLYVMNDEANMYVGLQIFGVSYNNPGVAGRGFDLLALLFDSNRNGMAEPGEDQKFLLTTQSNIDNGQRGAYLDLHVAPEGEDGADLHIDGLGRIVHSQINDVGDYAAEFEIPLNSGDPNDVSTSMDGRIRFNIILATQLNAAAQGGGLFGLEFVNTGEWGAIQFHSGQTPPDPDPVLPGMLTFISSEFEAGRQAYVMNADGTDLRSRTQGDAYVDTPFLSPDGQTIVFTSAPRNAEGQPVAESQEVYSINANRGRARRLTSNNVPDAHPAISPDGREIVIARQGNIWIMDINGRSERQATDLSSDTDPVWSPDGRIVFNTYRWGGLPEIAVIDPDGRNLLRVTRNGQGSFNPRVSPDAQWVTFFRYDGPGTVFDFAVSLFHPWNIYRIRLNGTDEEKLTGDGLLNYRPAFSPDGQGILYQKVLDVNSFYTVLHYVDLGTGRDRRVLNLSRVERFDWR